MSGDPNVKPPEPPSCVTTASKWVLAKYRLDAVERMLAMVRAYPKINKATSGVRLSDDPTEAEVLDAYDLLIANNRAMRDVFDASYPGRNP